MDGSLSDLVVDKPRSAQVAGAGIPTKSSETTLRTSGCRAHYRTYDFKVVVFCSFLDFLTFVAFFFVAMVFLLSFGLPPWAINYLYATLVPNVQSNGAPVYPAWNVDDAIDGLHRVPSQTENNTE